MTKYSFFRHGFHSSRQEGYPDNNYAFSPMKTNIVGTKWKRFYNVLLMSTLNIFCMENEKKNQNVMNSLIYNNSVEAYI